MFALGLSLEHPFKRLTGSEQKEEEALDFRGRKESLSPISGLTVKSGGVKGAHRDRERI